MLSRVRKLALVVVVVGCGALASAGSAAAGSYTVVQCSPSLSPVQGDALPEQTSPSYNLSAACDGAGLRVEETLAPSASDTFGRWTWRAPSGTVFTSMQAAASLVGGGSQVARLVAVAPDGSTTPFGAPGAAFEPADQIAGEFAVLRSELRCTSPSPCGGGIGAIARVRDVRLATEDRAAPVAAATGGTLLADEAVRGRRDLVFSITDEGGGVHDVSVRVNNRRVFADELPCQVVGDIATSLRPCPAQVTTSASVSTDDDPFVTGANVVEACGADLALDGLANEACDAREVFVDDLCPASTVGAGSKLTARFKPGGTTTAVRSDKSSQIRGELTSDAGDGIAGAKICALTQVNVQGGSFAVADTDKTGANGGYSLRLPPGPSRQVFVHRVAGDQVLARHGLRLKAKVRPSFQIFPNRKHGRVGQGERLRFVGALPGPDCASRSVKVQAKVGKRRWQVFRSVRTTNSCRYRTRFKLRETTRPTRFIFRAKVPAQPGYPYKAGASTVRVRTGGGNA